MLVAREKEGLKGIFFIKLESSFGGKGEVNLALQGAAKKTAHLKMNYKV